MGDYLLVHGAFDVGWVWDEVAKRLEKTGHRAHIVKQLPSTGTDPASLGDLSADTQCVRRMLDAIDGPVVLVGHSYSGMVITEFANHPRVRHTVYLSALWPEHGQSALNLLGDVLPAVIVRRDHRALEVTDDFDLAWRTFYADVDRERVQQLLARFVLQSYSCITAASTAPERSHPTTYVIGLHETEGSLASQEASAPKADHVVRLPASHMMQLSRPDELAEVLTQV
jgi:pimeloyl-ACP methyl ester carboxylesterase